MTNSTTVCRVSALRNPSRSLLALSVAATGGAAISCGSFGSTTVEGLTSADASTESADARAADDATRNDAGPSDGAPGDASDASSGPCNGEADCPRYVFVTSELFSGEDIGGSVGADGRCTNRAALPGTLPALAGRKWQAWVSDDIAQLSASARLTHGTMPYRLGNGTLIANSWLQLTSTALAHAIDVDETGKTIGSDFVWTGTQTVGQATPLNCTNWSINGVDNKGTVGQARAIDSAWTNSGALPCGEGHRLYCFEK